MKGLVYFVVIASVQASHFAHQSLHRRATGSTNCKTYTVQSGDTCASIGKSSGATWAQLLSWNSDINSECSYVTWNLSDYRNIDDRMRLTTSFLGTLVTSPARISASATPQATMPSPPPALHLQAAQETHRASSPPQRMSLCRMQEGNGAIVLIKTSSPVPSPIVSGTNTKCAQYYQIGSNETCDTVTEKSGISRSDL